MDLIGLKYCGGCNPVIDRSDLVHKIEQLLPPGCKLVTEQTASPWGKAILVCGCPTACADKPTLRCLAKQWIRVSGQTIDFEGVPEDQMAAIIARKIQT
jgi:hypothetical protein